MSENVKVAQRAVGAWNTGDVEALAASFEPDGEFRTFRSQLEGLAYVGPDGVRQFARDSAEEWEYLRIADTEYRDVGDQRVLMLGYMAGRGRASGMDLRVPAAWVLQVRNGRIAALRAYSKYEDAFEAVGLRE
jgi:ketosteroid isomerase-like protein